MQVFCVHGGIPSPENEGGGYIEAINKIPVPLPDPEIDSPIAWEILWSDPMRRVIVLPFSSVQSWKCILKEK